MALALKKNRQPPPSVVGDLSNWLEESGTAATQQKIARITNSQTHARRVRGLVWLLGGAAATLLAITFIWPAFLPSIKPSELLQAASPELAMFDLQFNGKNEAGEPFSVAAAKATRAGLEKTAPVTLTAPQAALQSKDGSALAVSAASGIYGEASQSLVLTGQVAVQKTTPSSAQPLQLHTEALNVDLAQNRVWADVPVKASGDFGTITSQALQLENNGKTIIFKGNAKAVLTGSAAN